MGLWKRISFLLVFVAAIKVGWDWVKEDSVPAVPMPRHSALQEIEDLLDVESINQAQPFKFHEQFYQSR